MCVSLTLLLTPQSEIGRNPIPGKRHGHRVVRLGSNLIAFGGYSASNTSSTRGSEETWLQKSGKGVWTRVGDLCEPKTFFSSVVIDNKVYAIGENIEQFDEKERRWKQIAAKGTVPTSHFAATHSGTSIYTLGGFPKALAGFRAFDTATQRVYVLPNPPNFSPGDHFHFLFSYKGRVHAIGGLSGDSFDALKSHSVFDGRGWQELSPPPEPLWAKFAASFVVGSRFYVFAENGGFLYDADRDSWKTISSLPTVLAVPATLAEGQFLYVLGGLVVKGVGAEWKYDIAKDRWTPIPRSSQDGTL